jgi:tetratricopeptide (TPR) repeat protein
MFNYRDVKRSTEIGEKVIKGNPNFAPAYNILGYHYMRQADLKNAEKNFNKYLSLRPDLSNAYDSKADYLMRAGKVEEAAASFEKAYELGMASAKGRADLAKAKFKYPGPSDKDKLEIKNIISASSAAYVNGNIDEILKDYSDQALAIFETGSSSHLNMAALPGWIEVFNPLKEEAPSRWLGAKHKAHSNQAQMEKYMRTRMRISSCFGSRKMAAGKSWPITGCLMKV